MFIIEGCCDFELNLLLGFLFLSLVQNMLFRISPSRYTSSLNGLLQFAPPPNHAIGRGRNDMQDYLNKQLKVSHSTSVYIQYINQ